VTEKPRRGRESLKIKREKHELSLTLTTNLGMIKVCKGLETLIFV